MEKIPKKIFIVPYRNRPEQKFFFCKYMNFLLEYTKDYEVYFSHQSDERSFNRGGCRNIGFLAMREKYPEHYKQITFIFNDLDTVPFNRIFDYETKEGVIKHYYGFTHSLGGIVVVKGSDFEKINGYPNYWSWGLEDTCLQKRCINNNIKIDRSDFYKIGSPQILQLFDGIERIINKKDPHKSNKDDGSTGLSTVFDLEYSIEKKSTNEMDNIYSSLNTEFLYINILNFTSETDFQDDEYFKYDLREPTNKITTPDQSRKTNNVNINPNSWSNISYYPTIEERKELPINTTNSLSDKKQSYGVDNNNVNKSIQKKPVRSSLHAMQQGKPVTHKFQQNNQQRMIQNKNDSISEIKYNQKSIPATFKQLKQENTVIFPPKTTNTAGGASALNRINLKYRMTKT